MGPTNADVWQAVREFGALVAITIVLLSSFLAVMYYLITVQYPRFLDTLRADLVAEREKFQMSLVERDKLHAETIRSLSERFVTSLREERDLFLSLMERFRGANFEPKAKRNDPTSDQ